LLEKLCEFHELADLLDTGKVADVLPQQLTAPETTPASCELRVPSKERFWEAAVFDEGIQFALITRRRWANGCVRRLGSKELRHAEGMHVEQEVSSHEAVASTTIHIKPG
jgi:hypothetical protein